MILEIFHPQAFVIVACGYFFAVYKLNCLTNAEFVIIM